MAAFTSTQNGNWNDPATWGGAIIYPGSVALQTDSVTINHTVTLTAAWVGTANQTVTALGASGQLIINADMVANAQYFDGAFTLVSGSIVSVPSGGTYRGQSSVDITVVNGAFFQLGSVATPVAVGNVAEWVFTVDAKGLPINATGSLIVQGAGKTQYGNLFEGLSTTNADLKHAKLTGDLVTAPANWAVGDEIVIVATDSTFSHTYSRTIDVIATSGGNTTLDWNTQAAVGENKVAGGYIYNITRNAVIRGTSTSVRTYIDVKGDGATTGRVNLDNVRTKFIGQNTAGKQGILLSAEASDGNFDNVVVTDFYCAFKTVGINSTARTFQKVNKLTVFRAGGAVSTGAVEIANGLYGMEFTDLAIIDGGSGTRISRGLFPSGGGMLFNNLVIVGCSNNALTTNGLDRIVNGKFWANATGCSANGRTTFLGGKFTNITATGAETNTTDISLGGYTCQVTMIGTAMKLSGAVPATPANLINMGWRPGYLCMYDYDPSSAGKARTYRIFGTIDRDLTATAGANGVSWKMTPNHATYRLESMPIYVNVIANRACTVKVKITKTVAQADGTGTRPRLVLMRNDYIGITADQSTTATAVQTEQTVSLTFTPTANGTAELYIDCDLAVASQVVYFADLSITGGRASNSNWLNSVGIEGAYVADMYALKAAS